MIILNGEFVELRELESASKRRKTPMIILNGELDELRELTSANKRRKNYLPMAGE